MTLRQEAYAMIDSLQDECARMVNADCLVTCNIKDFKTAKTKVYSPDEFVASLG